MVQNQGQRPLAIGADPQWLMNHFVVLSYVVQSREGLVTVQEGVPTGCPEGLWMPHSSMAGRWFCSLPHSKSTPLEENQ